MKLGIRITGVVAALIAVAIPAGAAAPDKGGNYGGGLLDDTVSNVATAKVSDNGKRIWVLLRVDCAGNPDRIVVAEFDELKISSKGAFSGTSDGATVKGTVDGSKISGTIAGTSCKPAAKKWIARDPQGPNPAKGGAKKGTTYYGTNNTVQDLFNAAGARGPFMLRISANGRSVAQAFMRAEWTCKEGSEPADSFFDDQGLSKKFKISAKGTFGRSFETVGDRADGTVTIFKTTFKGKFARGKVTGTWREVTEHRPNRTSNTLLGSCDSGSVAFTGIP